MTEQLRQLQKGSPRTGGGDPDGYTCGRSTKTVVPAQAGVILKLVYKLMVELGSPRTGGGDPDDIPF